jgi:L-asparaginase II
MAQEGRLLHSGGDPDTIAFLRSSAKPFQVLPFVEKGGLAYFDISDAELSLACASHDGFPLHLNAVRAMQAKIGVSESDLQCGGHAPDCKESAIDLVKRDCSPSNNYNNCSGKHTAMLACAKMQNLPIATYLDRAHPIQRY